MKIKLIQVGKTDEKWLVNGTEIFSKRLSHYLPYETITIPALKNNRNMNSIQQKQAEAQSILKQIQPDDFVVLLDERGKIFRSVEFADYLQKKMNSGLRTLTFVIGGPFGFAPEIYSRANGQLALSAMTFSHQMIRLFFTEQIYRAMTILKNEPYHNE